jgi:hypothetical protein
MGVSKGGSAPPLLNICLSRETYLSKFKQPKGRPPTETAPLSVFHFDQQILEGRIADIRDLMDSRFVVYR